MKELGMAIGTAAGSIFGSLMGNKMQQDQFGNQLTLMRKQHEYNEASANSAQERAYEMWEKTNYAAEIVYRLQDYLLEETAELLQEVSELLLYYYLLQWLSHNVSLPTPPIS